VEKKALLSPLLGLNGIRCK